MVHVLGGSEGPGVGSGELMHSACTSTQGLLGSVMLASWLLPLTIQPGPVRVGTCGQPFEALGTTLSTSWAPARLIPPQGEVRLGGPKLCRNAAKQGVRTGLEHPGRLGRSLRWSDCLPPMGIFSSWAAMRVGISCRTGSQAPPPLQRPPRVLLQAEQI